MPEPVQYRGMLLVVPDNDTEWQEYFAHARAHELVVRRCAGCNLLRHPPTHACPWCTDLRWSWEPVTGRGTIYSYQIIVHAVQPGFRDWTPFPVVLVELDEQRGRPSPGEALRIVANLVTPDGRPEREENVAIGKRVQVVFHDLADHLALPQFALSDEAPEEGVWRLA
jgi:uncharacterized OB-fold protein